MELLLLIIPPLLACFHWSDSAAAASPQDLQTAPPLITVTINPEARVSAVLTSSAPVSVPCNVPTTFFVKIINQAFVTAILQARASPNGEHTARLDFPAFPLTGIREELRSTVITASNPEPVDITIYFKLKNEPADLGGRDRVHFIVQCRNVQTTL